MQSKSYGDFKIIKYNSTNDVEIEFLSTGYKTSAHLSNIKKGAVKDPYLPVIYGVGYIGEGKYTSRIDGIQLISYKRWKEMLNRCYNKSNSSYKNKGNKCYSPENCCFVPSDINTLFISRKHERGEYPIGVRIKEGHIIAQINYMGKKIHLGTFNTVEDAFKAYKIAKEKCIKEYADNHKEEITERVYNALYNYNIEITD